MRGGYRERNQNRGPILMALTNKTYPDKSIWRDAISTREGRYIFHLLCTIVQTKRSNSNHIVTKSELPRGNSKP